MYSLMIFGSEGKGNGELYHPKGIACNEHGDIYVADTGNNRIARFFNNGKEVRFIINIGSFGTGRGKFSSKRLVHRKPGIINTKSSPGNSARYATTGWMEDYLRVMTNFFLWLTETGRISSLGC